MELKKATDLLYEIFPKHVAEALLVAVVWNRKVLIASRSLLMQQGPEIPISFRDKIEVKGADVLGE